MKKTLGAGLLVGIVAAMVALGARSGWTEESAAKSDKVFELRTYTANPGKLEALHKRFREHTNQLFKKHGIEIVGFWTPADGPEAQNTLVYIVSFPSRDAMKKSWAAFRDDPEWQKAKAESEKDGVLVSKVESKILTATDYSPIR